MLQRPFCKLTISSSLKGTPPKPFPSRFLSLLDCLFFSWPYSLLSPSVLTSSPSPNSVPPSSSPTSTSTLDPTLTPGPTTSTTSISSAFTRISTTLSLSLHDYFSDVTFTTSLLSDILSSSPSAVCRAALGLFHYLTHHRSFSPSDLSLSLSDLSDLSLSLLIHYFGRRHNFKVASLHSDHPHSIHAFISRLVSIGHPNQAIAFFEILDDKKTLSNLKILVGKLAEHKFALYVEHTVTKFVDKIFLNGGA